MEVTKTTVAILAAGCITAGAAAGFLVTRDSQPTGAVDSSSVQPDLGAPAPELPSAVEQSENVVSDGAAPASTPATTSAPIEARRTARAVEAPRPQSPAATQPAAPAPHPQSVPAAPAPPAAVDVITPIAPAPIEPSRPVVEPEPPRAAEPPVAEYQELALNSGSVIGLQVETAVSSETARIEDAVIARVTRDVKVGDHVAIPAGAKAQGTVTLVERGGKLKDRARLGVRFTSIVLADGTRVPITTETIYREGDAPGRESTTKIGGGAIGGAIIGGILGGAKGAAIGSAIGGGAGSAAVMAGGRNPATLSAGAPVTIRLQEPATVTVER